MSHKTMRIESHSCCYFASGHWHRLDARNVTINKLRTKQCHRYVQPSNKDEFEFSDSLPTSINKRTRSVTVNCRSVINQLSTIYLINESLAILFYDLYIVLANRLVRTSLWTLSVYQFIILNIFDGFNNE